MGTIASCRDDVQNIMDGVTSKLDEFKYPNSLLETRTIGRCFLVSIFWMVKSAYRLFSEKEALGLLILARSICEYNIDFRYLVIKNDFVLNRRFVNYYKLTRYWLRDKIEYVKKAIPQIEEEYRQYIYSEFADVIAKTDTSNHGGDLLYPKDVDKTIKKRFRGHGWSGLSSEDRIKEILQVDNDFTTKDYLPFTFKIFSEYTHPTPYSTVPHFDFRTGTFQFHYIMTELDLKADEIYLIIAVELAVKSMCMALGDHDGSVLMEYYDSITESLPGYNAYLQS